MADRDSDAFPRIPWNGAAIWMGCDYFGLMRLLAHNRFRVTPAYLGDCLIDVLFSLGNTCLRCVQWALWAHRFSRAELKEDPIFIIGHWRTGTTLLHELLSLDRRLRCPTTFECFLPNHFLVSQWLLKRWTAFVLPPRRPSDNMSMGWDLPQEDEFALCNLGLPSPYAMIAFPNRLPQFGRYLELDDLSDPERRRWKSVLMTFLKQLVCRRPGRIVLKSPTHTFRLPVLCEMFPKSHFVHLVRDPYTVFMSTVRLWKSLFTSHGYQKPTWEGLEEYVFDTFGRMHRRLEATRGLVDPRRFHELRYEDLVSNPVAEVHALYGRLGLAGFDAVEPAVRAYVAARADYRTNRYELTPQLRGEIARRWKPYFEKYGYALG